MKFTGLVSKIGKPKTVAEALADKTPGEIKSLAGKLGVSVRTIQKWKSGKGRRMPDGTYKPQEPSKKLGGSERVIKESTTSKTRRNVAAGKLRQTQAVHVGRVQVRDKSPRGKGPRAGMVYRNLGTIHLRPAERDLMNQAADALERGDTARAEELTNQALMKGYGGGADSALSIEENSWPSGIHLI
jgi:hypothetical protein